MNIQELFNIRLRDFKNYLKKLLFVLKISEFHINCHLEVCESSYLHHSIFLPSECVSKICNLHLD